VVELLHRTLRVQLGAADPAAHAPGVDIRILDIDAQFYVTADLAPNTMCGIAPYTLWLAPDRALQVGGTAPDGFVSDMTDGLAVFEISGPRAGDILAMGCTLDPDGPLLAAGRCAQTAFGGVKIVIYRYNEGAVRIHVERPLAAFLVEWFQMATSALQ
jgi:heterotetrameric sarcosine oxidase gamma subunit